MNLGSCLALILSNGDSFTVHYNAFSVNKVTGEQKRALTYGTLKCDSTAGAVNAAAKLLGDLLDGAEFITNTAPPSGPVNVVGQFVTKQVALPATDKPKRA